MHCSSKFSKKAFFIVVSMLLFTACARKSADIISDDDNGGYASDASRIEWAGDDVISIADAAGLVYNGAYMRTTHTTGLGTCATVGTDTNSIPHKLTIRFGPADCQCLDGRLRRGTIMVSYNGQYFNPSQIHTITFDNYFINDNQLTGVIKTIRVDTTVLGNWYYKVIVNDSLNMSQDPLNSQYVIWQGTIVRKWAQGYATTADRSDDVFSISGNATLTRPSGHQFSCDIATPLQFALNCDFCESGVIDVTGFTPPMRVLNYGNGACDKFAQFSNGPNVYNITLVK